MSRVFWALSKHTFIGRGRGESGGRDEDKEYQNRDLIKKKKSKLWSQAVHAVHRKPNHSKPEVMHVLSWIQDLGFFFFFKSQIKTKNSYLSRRLLTYRLMYNIDKLNRDQQFCYLTTAVKNVNSEIYDSTWKLELSYLVATSFVIRFLFFSRQFTPLEVFFIFLAKTSSALLMCPWQKFLPQLSSTLRNLLKPLLSFSKM